MGRAHVGDLRAGGTVGHIVKVRNKINDGRRYSRDRKDRGQDPFHEDKWRRAEDWMGGHQHQRPGCVGGNVMNLLSELIASGRSRTDLIVLATRTAQVMF